MLGINATEAATLSTADLTKTMDGVQALGCKYIRIEAPWAQIEPTQGTFNWTGMDAAVNAAKSRGIQPLLVLGVHRPTTGFWFFTQPAAWANGAAFGVFCQAVASRYQLPEYEIWNEQNNAAYMSSPGFLWFPGGASASLYVSYLQPAYTAIKKAQPSAKVIFGGLMATVSWSNTNIDPVTFLTQCYQAGAKGFFDELAYHPYSYDLSTFQDQDPVATGASIATITSLFNFLSANNDQKSIRLTEWGFHTDTSTATVVQTRLAHELPLLELPFVSGSYLYDFRDYGGSYYGVVDGNYVPKQPIYDWAKAAFAAN